MHKHKNDYTCVVFFPEGMPKKWMYVHTLNGFVKFLNQKHATWKYCNVYERRTGKYLKRFYPGNIVPSFLSLAFFFVLPLVPASQATPQPLNSTFSIAFLFNLQFKPLIHPVQSAFTNGFNNSATIPTLLGGGNQC